MEEELVDSLEELMNNCGKEIFPEMKNGTVLEKSWVTNYVIDLENVLNSPEFQPLKEAKILADIYFSIRKVINHPTKYKERMGNFSEVLKSGKGECVEKSALFQIAMDNFSKMKEHRLSKGKSFYIKAFLKHNEFGFDRHAFNIVTSEKENLLVDVENPIKTNHGQKVPYIVPVNGLDWNTGELIVPAEYKFKRTYSF